MGQLFSCPNSHIISYPMPFVKQDVVIFTSFYYLNSKNLYNLYNIPSCKIRKQMLLYSYKEVIPMYS